MRLYRVLLGVADEAVVTLRAVQETQGAAYRAWEAQREKARAQATDPEADWKGLAESLHRALINVRSALDPDQADHSDLIDLARKVREASLLAPIQTTIAGITVLNSTDAGKVEGLISERDILRARAAEAEKAAADDRTRWELLRKSNVHMEEELQRRKNDIDNLGAERDSLRRLIGATRLILDPEHVVDHPDLVEVAKVSKGALDVAIRDADAEGKRALELESQLVRFLKAETNDRATDYDLGRIAHAVDQPDSYKDRWELGGEGLHRRYVAMATAVAARVRQEPGLVERLVDGKATFNAFERESDATWTVRVGLPGTGGYTTNVTNLAAADVPTTLARLAGLDGAT